MVREKKNILQGQGRVREFYFESGKNFEEKVLSLVKKGDLLKLISLNERVERAAARRGLKPLLYLTCIYLVSEILFLYGKRQAILKSSDSDYTSTRHTM